MDFLFDGPLTDTQKRLASSEPAGSRSPPPRCLVPQHTHLDEGPIHKQKEPGEPIPQVVAPRSVKDLLQILGHRGRTTGRGSKTVLGI